MDSLPAHPGFRFGRHDSRIAPQLAVIENAPRTDAEGRAVLPLAFPGIETEGKPLEAEIVMRLAEGSARPVEGRLPRALAPDAPLIGIRPLFEGVVGEGAEAGFELPGLGPDGTPQGMRIDWALNRVETRYQWYQTHGDWAWEPVTTRSRVTSGEAVLAGGRLSLDLPVQWGRYELVATRADALFAETSVAFDAGWYAPADTSRTPDMLEVALDKSAYAPGETATLRIVPRAPLDVALKVEGIRPGETAHATIAAVDPGILNLTGFASPDPDGHYFGQWRFGMGLRDVYGRLIHGMSGEMGRVRSGGDAGAGQRMQAPPPTEDLVVLFEGPVQVASAALPLLYLDEIAVAMGPGARDDLRARVDQAIAAVLANQAPNGSFGLWRPDAGDFWLDAYVTDFLSRARANGFAVLTHAFRAALDNLRNRIAYAPDFDEGGEDITYALMVLAREGSAAMADLRYYADVKGRAFATPPAAGQLGAALAAYGDSARAEAMFTHAAGRMGVRIGAEEPPLWRADYGTDLRDAAGLLALAAEAGSAAVNRTMLAGYGAVPGRARSTQEAAWMLLAAHALIDRPGAGGFTLNGAQLDGPLLLLRDGDAPAVIGNGSGADEVLTLTAFGVPDTPESADGNGFAITRRHYTPDGAPATLDAVPAGTRLVTVIEVTPFALTKARLMIADPLPAGFEIDNPNLLRAGDVRALDWLEPTVEATHAEFRQDRFLAAVDLRSGAPIRLACILRATAPGSYRHPAASVEDMYRPDRRAWTDAGRATVSEWGACRWSCSLCCSSARRRGMRRIAGLRQPICRCWGPKARPKCWTAPGFFCAPTPGPMRWRLATSLDAVDPGYLAMLIAREDRRFYRHPGIDPLALLRAAGQAVRHGRVVSGGSTLTMQVARLLEDSGTGHWGGKLRQMRVALALERRLGKDEILTLYLNRAPVDGNLEGLRADSLAWFGKPPRRLTPAEAALLVALPRAPEARRPDRDPAAARAGRDRVLARMAQAGLLGAEELAVAIHAPVPTTRHPFPALAPHLADRARAADPGAALHRLTLEAGLQARLEALFRCIVAPLGPAVSAALIVADHRTGEILVHLGSPDFTDSARAGYVDVTIAPRSPGSTLKPLVYGLAFAEGLGPARLVAGLERAGIAPAIPGGVAGLAVALGGLGVTLEDLARLYAAIANGGRAVGLHCQTGAGAAIPGPPVLTKEAAWQVADILHGTPAPPAAAQGRIAFKTGTSFGHRDAWAVGFDGAHVIAVWMGRPDRTPFPGSFGADSAAPLLFEAFARLTPPIRCRPRRRAR